MPAGDLNTDRLLTLSEEYSSELVAPPLPGDDVCPVCLSWRDGDDEELCRNCSRARDWLPGWCHRVVPVSLYRKPSILRDWLTHYKPNREQHHPEYGDVVGTLLWRFWREHGDALLDEWGPVDGVCLVPSTSRPPPHPFTPVVEHYLSPAGLPVLPLLERGTGEIAWREFNADAYRVVAPVDGKRVIIVDDVYVTGARSQSAAATLTAHGATVAGILVAARRFNPDYDEAVGAIWKRQAARTYRFAERYWTPERW